MRTTLLFGILVLTILQKNAVVKLLCKGAIRMSDASPCIKAGLQEFLVNVLSVVVSLLSS